MKAKKTPPKTVKTRGLESIFIMLNFMLRKKLIFYLFIFFFQGSCGFRLEGADLTV